VGFGRVIRLTVVPVIVERRKLEAVKPPAKVTPMSARLMPVLRRAA